MAWLLHVAIAIALLALCWLAGFVCGLLVADLPDDPQFDDIDERRRRGRLAALRHSIGRPR